MGMAQRMFVALYVVFYIGIQLYSLECCASQIEDTLLEESKRQVSGLRKQNEEIESALNEARDAFNSQSEFLNIAEKWENIKGKMKKEAFSKLIDGKITLSRDNLIVLGKAINTLKLNYISRGESLITLIEKVFELEISIKRVIQEDEGDDQQDLSKEQKVAVKKFSREKIEGVVIGVGSTVIIGLLYRYLPKFYAIFKRNYWRTK